MAIAPEQLPLREPIPMGRLEQLFWTFHNTHPDVYAHLLKFAREYRRRRGAEAESSIVFLYERVRWYVDVDLGMKESPRLNNNHRPFYSRLLMVHHADLVGMFRLRKQAVQCTFGPDNVDLPDDIHVIDA